MRFFVVTMLAITYPFVFIVESEEVERYRPASVRSVKRLVQFSRKPLSLTAPIGNYRCTKPGMR